MKIKNNFYESGEEDFDSYCNWLKRKNNSVLFLLETYLGRNLNDDEDLKEIRNIILDVSGDISRIPEKVMVGVS